MGEPKLQSAMEYLMTYGWAILIIAVVLGALFGLGFFNSANLAPKVAAGSCQVYRPQGPGTTAFINLEGTCNNELPQYVAQFNGASSTINTGAIPLPAGSSARSEFAWIYTFNLPAQQVIYGYGTQVTGNAAWILLENSLFTVEEYGGGPSFSTPLTANSWYFVGYTYASGATTATVYVDGQSQVQTMAGGHAFNTVLSGSSCMGARQGCISSYFDGYIANLQVYNTSLSSNEVTALYQEGVGGVPLVLNNLVGWWPLNGNANDYSGNQNNGVPTAVVYTSSWTSGYTAP